MYRTVQSEQQDASELVFTSGDTRDAHTVATLAMSDYIHVPAPGRLQRFGSNTSIL